MAWGTGGTPRKDKDQRWELAGVSDELIAESFQCVQAIYDDAEQRRVVVHFTLTHASWMNLVQVWFSIIERQAIRHVAVST